MKLQLNLKQPYHIFSREVQLDLDCGQTVIATEEDGRPLHPANNSLFIPKSILKYLFQSIPF